MKRSESLAKEAVLLWNWRSLDLALKVSASKPSAPKKKLVKKAAVKRTPKKVTKRKAPFPSGGKKAK